MSRGILEGLRPPAAAAVFVIYSAHIDPRKTAQSRGQHTMAPDDNPMGVAGLLEAGGRAFSQPGSAAPKRSLSVLATRLRKNGLLGSAHFHQHPPVRSSRSANVNRTGGRTGGLVDRGSGGNINLGAHLVSGGSRPALSSEKTPNRPGRRRGSRIFYSLGSLQLRRKGVPFYFSPAGPPPTTTSRAMSPHSIDEKGGAAGAASLLPRTTVADAPSRPCGDRGVTARSSSVSKNAPYRPNTRECAIR